MHIEIRNTGFTLTARERQGLEDRLRSSLDRFGGDIRSAVMRLRDLNGPRGGVDVRCHLSVATYRGTTIVIDERAESVRAAVDVALDRAAFNIARAAGRSRALRGRVSLRTDESGVPR